MKPNKNFTKDNFQKINKLYYDERYDQADIAAEIGCDQGSISRILSGKFESIEVRRVKKKVKYSPFYRATKEEVAKSKGLLCNREERSTAKINLETAKEIRKVYFSGEKTECELAKEHGLNQSTICRIIKGDKWKSCRC